MSDCREFFRRHALGHALSRELQQIDEQTQLAWEAETASEYSPCPVGNQEQLARQVLDPAFFDADTGEVKPTLFDDASSRGASINRRQYLTDQQLHAKGNDRVLQALARNTHPKRYIGFVSLAAQDVRRIMAVLNGMQSRAFGVYDTAEASDPSHADICQLLADRAVGRSVRSQLFQLAKGALCKPE